MTPPIQFLTDKDGKRLAVVIRMDIYGHMVQKLEALRQPAKPTDPMLPPKKYHS